MRQADFESLLFLDVEKRAAREPDPPHGKQKYYHRPWTKLRDEMLTKGARTVGELPTRRITVYYHATKSGNGSAFGAVKRFFGSAA